MRFYSGFCLRNESRFFDTWLRQDAYTVAGFSYGAIKAVEYSMRSKERIERLQLFSPAFFRDKPEAFKRLQLKAYRKDSTTYISRFVENSFLPFAPTDVEVTEEGIEALEALLYYEWPERALQSLTDRGVRIEVYLGEKDALIDADAARTFFARYATVYYIKGANHFLQGDYDA